MGLYNPNVTIYYNNGGGGSDDPAGKVYFVTGHPKDYFYAIAPAFAYSSGNLSGFYLVAPSGTLSNNWV